MVFVNDLGLDRKVFCRRISLISLFIMYMNVSGPSLLIESTDSIITSVCIVKIPMYNGNFLCYIRSYFPLE